MSTGKKVTIAAGYVSDEALQYLREHGAVIDTALSLSMIELPEDAEICNPGYQGVRNEYVIEWRDADGSDSLEWIVVNLELDVNDTKVSLKKHIERTADPEPTPGYYWNGRQHLRDNIASPTTTAEREGF